MLLVASAQPLQDPLVDRLAGAVATQVEHHAATSHANPCGDLLQPKDVADVVFVAPTHQAFDRIATVTTDKDLDVRPARTNLSHQQFGDAASMVRRTDAAGPKIRNQDLIAGKDVQLKKAVAVIKTVEVSPQIASSITSSTATDKYEP